MQHWTTSYDPNLQQEAQYHELRPTWDPVAEMNSQTGDPNSDINSAPWPRRTPKACASCRRDKIRCDGARPCGNCSKRGYSSEQCIDGCENCRRARVRCEDGKPCRRCMHLQLECVEEFLIAPAGQETASSSSSRPVPSQRPGGSDRAKLACQNCRRDNKKCDDQRPCSRCVARSEECVHVARGPKLVKLRCEGCRQDNKRCEDARPCAQCVEIGRECISVPRKGRGHGTRVKAACMSCRRDKIRCDGSRPCGSCARKGYECVDRPCRDCLRNGKGEVCTHRRTQDISVSDTGDETTDTSQFVSDASPSISPIDAQQPNPFNHPQMVPQQMSYYPPMGNMQSFYYPPAPISSPMELYSHDTHAGYMAYPVVHHSQADDSMMPPQDNAFIASMLCI